ncbi:hypothetical protein A0256_02305 [Mucilaginibacter sp. PAMC 26640]|nr:hypothetical protein A0256_02305 [Mucilaginibacter sp. PAMC 26640]
MNVFFDTSSLTKLYHQEDDTNKLLNFLNANPGFGIYISELTTVEIYSAIFKKVRMGHLVLPEAEMFLSLVDKDFKNFNIIEIDTLLLKQAQRLVAKYGTRGLRTLDAIQLASAISQKQIIHLALTGDILLKQLLIAENFNCDF